ncbi:C-type lectin domain family 17, member A-like [Saccostrea cucullata]|uniref:C-type lectin domain family 17, member A-like n=1 Tax=Saccostrea cuccullata TaxID=36930 RepID=UPI002ED5EE24
MVLWVLISVLSLSFIRGCFVGWLPFQDKCYFFSHTTDSWPDAGSTCTQLGSKLAEPRTIEAARFLISHSQSLDKSFWMGMSDLVEEDRWEYSSTHDRVTLDLWQPGEPNAHTDQNCMVMWQPFHGKWGDNVCSEKLYFVCEIDNGDPPQVVG